MNPNFDMTGVAVIEGLRPETPYEYQFGYFFADYDLPDAQKAVAEIADWQHGSRGQFQTASNDQKKPRTLVIGSCRYLLMTLLGGAWDARGDKTFRSILEQLETGTEIHQLIMMGDQIYADDLNAFTPRPTLEQFYRRYRAAFSQEHIRELMSQVPTYMTLDDHEIEDNWPAKATEKDWLTLFPIAMHAYQCYQLSHSPNIAVQGGRLAEIPDHCWYTHSDGCCDIFVTDTRTERRLAEGDEHPEIIGPEQMNALKNWLTDGSGKVKVVVTAVPFFPDSSPRLFSDGQDKWAGFPQQRAEILEHIEQHQVNKVLFCGGDVHASVSAELISPSGLKIISAVSSPFFWPRLYQFRRPSARNFDLKGEIDGGNAGKFKLQKASTVIGESNFSRLTITPKEVTINVFERKGAKAAPAKKYTW